MAAVIIRDERRKRRWRREIATHPIDRSGPRHEHTGDQFLRHQIAGLLGPGEVVSHQAPCVWPRAGETELTVARRKGALVAVTDRRLILVVTDAGAFGPLLENAGIVSIWRAQIARHRFGFVGVEGFHLTLNLHDGDPVVLLFQRSQLFGNIDAFWRDVPRIVSEWVP